ncbi:MAG TPA: hypothetical protein VGW34_08170, partial [Allosphingosinicella sp.]|nr:hypothetical protein [Allosphingosinicella sp.]
MKDETVTIEALEGRTRPRGERRDFFRAAAGAAAAAAGGAARSGSSPISRRRRWRSWRRSSRRI